MFEYLIELCLPHCSFLSPAFIIFFIAMTAIHLTELDISSTLDVEHIWICSRRRQWQPTPVLLPGESQGRGSLVGCRLWGHTEWHTTEAT